MIGTSTRTSIDPGLKERFQHLWRLVGHTPMVAIEYRYKGREGKVYAKCEQFNLTGSIKDRMALYILEEAYHQGLLKPGDRIVEATSGNTGISLAAIGNALGHPITILLPDWLSSERIAILHSLGAKVVTVSRKQGGFRGSIDMAEEIAAHNKNVFLPRQFDNYHNARAHEYTTAREIWAQLQQADQPVHAFVAGVGTGGTIMGVGRYLKSKNPQIKVHPIEPLESPTLSTGYKTGSHRIQGISDEFIPSIVELRGLDRIIGVSDGDAILMAQALAKQLGLAVGISSGANIVAAIQVRAELGGNAGVVTVLPDSNKKYLSTDLVREEPVAAHYLTPQVELVSFSSLK